MPSRSASGFLFELHQAEDDVHDLHAGIVEVVLDFDGLALEAQAADQGVAQAGVAEMADMGGLIGIDVGVLDDDFSLVGPEGGPSGAARRSAKKASRSRNKLMKPGPGDFHPERHREVAPISAIIFWAILRGFS